MLEDKPCKFSRQTYEMVAEVLCADLMPKCYWLGQPAEPYHSTVAAFADHFEQDSDLFDRDKFYKAVYGRKA